MQATPTSHAHEHGSRPACSGEAVRVAAVKVMVSWVGLAKLAALLSLPGLLLVLLALSSNNGGEEGVSCTTICTGERARAAPLHFFNYLLPHVHNMACTCMCTCSCMYSFLRFLHSTHLLNYHSYISHFILVVSCR